MKRLYPLSEKTILTCDKYDGQIFVGIMEVEAAPPKESLRLFGMLGAGIVAGAVACCLLAYWLQ